MTTLCFFSATGGELTLVSQALSRMKADGLDVTLFGRTKEQLADPQMTSAFARAAARSDVVVLSFHGGTGSCPAWPDLVGAWQDRRKSGLSEPWIHIQPTSGDDDGLLAAQEWVSGLTDGTWKGVFSLLGMGGSDNVEAALRVLVDRATGGNAPVPEAVPAPTEGIWHPRHGLFTSLAEYQHYLNPDRPTVGITFPRSYWLEHNTEHIEALVEAVESLDANTVPFFCLRLPDSRRGNMSMAQTLQTLLYDEEGTRVIDTLIDVHGMSMTAGVPANADAYPNLGVSVLHALTSYEPRQMWEARGMGSMDIATQAAQPEFDGALITKFLATREADEVDELTGAVVPRMIPVPGRPQAMAELALSWAHLARTPASQRKIAIVFHHHPPRNDRIGCASGLDTFESVRQLLIRMAEEGYYVPEQFERADDIAQVLLSCLTCDQRWLTPEQMHDRAEAHAGLEISRPWYRALPESVRECMDRNWGPHPGTLFVHDNEFSFAGHLDGNILLTIQPPRGNFEAVTDSAIHDPLLPPPHHYLAHYRWIRDVFKADAVIHVGTHGSLEWLPGKGLGLSDECYPELALDRMVNIYPYIINNPGEGTQAKRRSAAALIDHLTPPMRQAGLYDSTAEIDRILREHAGAQSQSPQRARLVAEQIWDAVVEAGLNTDLGLTADDIDTDPVELLNKVHHHLLELQDREISDGLHVLGRLVANQDDPGEVVEYVAQLTRQPNGQVPSLREAVLNAWGTSLDEVSAKAGEPVAITGDLPRTGREIMAAAHQQCVDLLAPAIAAQREGCVDADRAHDLAIQLCQEQLGTQRGDVVETLTWVITDLMPRLDATHDEIDSIMTALDGGFVSPGPSGAPTRGNAHILPTGRNFFSLDPETMPTPTGWREGVELADQLLSGYAEAHPDQPWPRTVGVVVWGTANMRSGGADIAEILYLMGVRPVWESSGLVSGLKIIDPTELGRPRIDVSPRISGLFRDAFPNLVEMVDRAVRMVAALPEADGDNMLRAHVEADTADMIARGVDVEQARRKATLRIFGCPPGGYGAGVEELIETKAWQDKADLGRAYIAASSHAYGEGVFGDVETQRFTAALSRMDVTVKNEDTREYDMLSCTDFYNYYGGLIAAATTVRGEAPMSFVGDSSDPSRIATRTTTEEARLILRSRILNPSWIEGLQRHGYKGAGDLSKVLDILIGWDATADVVDDGLWEKVARRYALDPAMQEWFREVNPHALHNIVDKLLDAAQREVWQADPSTVEELQNTYADIEGTIEEVSDDPQPSVAASAPAAVDGGIDLAGLGLV
ncbi:cobaltochelatase subunit CobN [Cutibacterium sp.]|uniref:cobaltochelatase subunit CobN n=1 Tax=Cutibacterium sp. TaxID=1912221 RepID=UPI0026DB4973|nr:cobaltochelatase subunit CobN [Cutibacterium sp.]MDO4412621.1 cobaltochelatase subunit CobN [Cutibacterium sp.]